MLPRSLLTTPFKTKPMTNSFAAPARSGRPVGSRPKAKPKTVAAFVQNALSTPPTPPPPAPPKPRNPRRKAGAWEGKSPAERSAYAKELAARRKPENMRRSCQRPGTPKRGGWTHETAAIAKTAAQLEAERLVAKLQANGKIAPDDHEGAAATVEALTIVASPGGATERRKWALRLLRHYHPELAAGTL